MFSKAKAKIKSVAKKVVSVAKGIGSAIAGSVKSAGQTAGSQLTAAAGNLKLPKAKSGAMDFSVGANLTPAQTTTAQNTIRNYTGTVGGINSQGGAGTSTYGPPRPQLPITISSGPQKGTSRSSGGSGLSGPGASILQSASFDESSFTGTLSAQSISGFGGGGTAGATSGGGTGGTYSNSPYSLPPQYQSTDPGNVNTTGLASPMAGYYTRNEDGTFEPVTKDPFAEKSDEDIIKEKAALYKEAFGEPRDVYDDPEVRQAQEDRRRAQEALLAPTAELNAILSQAQRDNLQLRQTAQKEGVVEAVYGQQVAAINYNAAIRALPLQSHIAALQGNLDLAQDYLSELVTMKKEQIKTQYDYNKGLFDTIYSALDAKEKRVADKLIKENDRAYKAEDELIDYKASLIAAINAQKDPNAHVRISAVERSKDKISASKAAGDITQPEDFSPQEKRKLEQAGLLNATRQQQLDHLYKDSGSQFTPTQLNKGATNAGLERETFDTLDSDVKNYYVNLSPARAQSLKDTLAEVASGEKSSDEVKEYIDGTGASQPVKDYLNTLVDAATPQENGSVWSRFLGAIGGMFN